MYVEVNVVLYLFVILTFLYQYRPLDLWSNYFLTIFIFRNVFLNEMASSRWNFRNKMIPLIFRGHLSVFFATNTTKGVINYTLAVHFFALLTFLIIPFGPLVYLLLKIFFKLFGFPIFWLWAYLMKFIPETSHAQYIIYLRFY